MSTGYTFIYRKDKSAPVFNDRKVIVKKFYLSLQGICHIKRCCQGLLNKDMVKAKGFQERDIHPLRERESYIIDLPQAHGFNSGLGG